MGRRWAATYIFHLGQIQLPREGGDEKIQQLTERVNRTVQHTMLQNEMRFLAMYNACSPLTCIKVAPYSFIITRAASVNLSECARAS